MIRTFDKAGSVRWTRRGAALAALLALVLLPSFAGAQSVEDKYRAAREQASLFNLAAGPSTVLQVNQYQCGLLNNGATCTDVFDSPTGGGGFWPTGSANQYMFNSGLQVVGIIPADAGFDWAGDTTGAFFMDASGLRQHGTPITDIYNSLDADDLDNWPTLGSVANFPSLNGIVVDTGLFAPALIGRKAASQQDTWVAYWDGDPNKSGGREHPMGIMVEQRTMAWNYPAGNESTIFLVYKFTNVTNNPKFQADNEAKYGISLPDGGWRFDSVYVAYDADPDVGPTATNNYVTPVLPFDLGVAYIGSFYDNSFIYPTALFHPPFFTTAPGLSGMKYLKSPIDPATGKEVGLTSVSQHTNGGAFSDPRTVQQGWRYISLNVDAGKGDPSCSFDEEEVRARRSCYLGQTQSDVRLFIGSGPFSLNPGESASIAIMMYAAATVNVPGITPSPSADNKPGVPDISPGCNGAPIRPIEAAAGYIAPRPGTCPGPGEKIDQRDVEVVPESLLGKALVSQAVFDNKFLLGFAPETPTFYLVPGDNQVTVVWEPSKTDVNGDPFFEAAGDPQSPLYDANYRQYDVEGYRVYRGTSPANLQLVAQYDKKGTTFKDVLCVTDGEHITGSACSATHNVDIISPFVQYSVVQELATGVALATEADTALSNEIRAGTAMTLKDTGIPYAYIDNTAKNGFQYFYKVTAFDINSARSGPSSLESAAPAKSIMPVSASAALGEAKYQAGLFGRSLLSDYSVGLDPTTGEFTGPQPPTNGLSGSFQAFAPALLPAGSYQVKIDSIVPDYYGGIYYLTATGVSLEVEYELHSAPDGPESLDLPVVTVPSESTARQSLLDRLTAAGVQDPDKYAPPLAGSLVSKMDWEALHWSSGDSDWAYTVPNFWDDDPPNTVNGGSRWFAGDNESTPNPTVGFGTAGSLPGITTIFRPNPYQGIPSHNGLSSDLMRRLYQSTWPLKRAADVKVYWGSAQVDSVVDIVHDMRVPYTPIYRVGYGFYQDGDGNGVLNWGDMRYVPALLVGGAGVPSGFTITSSPKDLAQQPVVMPVDVDGDMVGDGDGFAMYINGEWYFFQGSVPSNTVWTLRTYSGAIKGGPGIGAYEFVPRVRPADIPGLSFKLEVEAPAQIVSADADLSQVHTVPDPYYANSLFDRGPATKELQFVNLPPQATVRIYSMSGVLVDVINHDDPTGGGIEAWNLRNRSQQFVASGVYFFHVSTPDGREHVGKFTVVNSGFAR